MGGQHPTLNLLMPQDELETPVSEPPLNIAGHQGHKPLDSIVVDPGFVASHLDKTGKESPVQQQSQHHLMTSIRQPPGLLHFASRGERRPREGRDLAEVTQPGENRERGFSRSTGVRRQEGTRASVLLGHWPGAFSCAKNSGPSGDAVGQDLACTAFALECTA